MFGFRKFLKGIQLVPKTTSTVSSAGDMDFNTTTNKVTLHNGTSGSPVVTEAHTATLTNKTYDLGTGTSKAIVTASGVITESTTTAAEIANVAGITGPINTTYVRTDTLGVANGTATLDNTGKLPNSQLPITAMEYLGNWDASTNTPTLADGVGNAGDVYRASVAGTVNFGSGPIVFNISDWAVYSGSVWQQSPAPGAVSSVFGRTGTVTAQSGDYTKAQVGLGNVDNTSDVNKPVSTAQQTYIDNKVPISTKGDLLTVDGFSVNQRLPVGVLGEVLTANPPGTLGLTWTKSVTTVESRVSYLKATAQTGISAGAGITNVSFQTQQSETNQATWFNTSTGVCTVQEDGNYDIFVSLDYGFSSAPGNTSNVGLILFIPTGSTSLDRKLVLPTPAGFAQSLLSGYININLLQNDSVSVGFSYSGSNPSVTLQAGVGSRFVLIRRGAIS